MLFIGELIINKVLFTDAPVRRREHPEETRTR